jgi:parallel beta-helix repeat protein
MAALVVALGLGLALSLGLWSSWTASAQDTFIVNDNTTPAEDGCDTPDYQTDDIQEAIDDGDVADGDTLMICDGTYSPPDSIQVTKELIIEGRAAADRADILIESVAHDGFVVSAENVTIRHLTLEGSGTDRGIWVSDNNATIEDVEVSDWSQGIFLDAAEGTTVQDSDIHDNANQGIVAADGSGNTIQRNASQDNGTGIDLEDEDEALIAENVVSGNTLEQIFLDADSAIINVFVLRNQITSASDGIFIDQIDRADSLIVIGGRPEDANTFSGTYDPVAGDYYVELACVSENTVDATYNFWGAGLQATDIAARIFNDETDAATECPVAADDPKGAVVFHPWATEPAPTVTPSPTPTATATPTPGNTRTINLSPQGWHSLVWSGANGTAPATALNCIAGQFSIAYMYVGTTGDWLRYVPGNTTLTNITTVNKYDSLFVLINVAGASCVMPVD